MLCCAGASPKPATAMLIAFLGSLDCCASLALLADAPVLDQMLICCIFVSSG
jgi:hypothetical protein